MRSRLIAAIPETTTLVLFDPELGELSATVRKQLPTDVDHLGQRGSKGKRSDRSCVAHLAVDKRFAH